MWIELRGVSHEYGGRRNLVDVSLRLEKGDIGCLVGPKGLGQHRDGTAANVPSEPLLDLGQVESVERAACRAVRGQQASGDRPDLGGPDDHEGRS